MAWSPGRGSRGPARVLGPRPSVQVQHSQAPWGQSPGNGGSSNFKGHKLARGPWGRLGRHCSLAEAVTAAGPRVCKGIAGSAPQVPQRAGQWGLYSAEAEPKAATRIYKSPAHGASQGRPRGQGHVEGRRQLLQGRLCFEASFDCLMHFDNRSPSLRLLSLRNSRKAARRNLRMHLRKRR